MDGKQKLLSGTGLTIKALAIKPRDFKQPIEADFSTMRHSLFFALSKACMTFIFAAPNYWIGAQPFSHHLLHSYYPARV